MAHIIDPGDYTAKENFDEFVQKVFNDASNDEIYFNSGEFKIGTNTINVKRKMRIGGTPDGAERPVIYGKCGNLLNDELLKANPSTPRNCGIFSINSEGTVEITGLHLKHEIELEPGKYPHGSATIADFVDNAKPSTLIITDCEINSSATAAINSAGTNTIAGDSIRHDFIIRDCTITAVQPTRPKNMTDEDFWLAGNWLSVKLGPMADPLYPTAFFPIDIRGSYFEVSNCVVDPATFAGIAIWACRSDQDTNYLVCKNQIGQKSTNDVQSRLSFGVLDYFDGMENINPYGLPLGTIQIVDNKIKVADVFNNQSAGIGVWVNSKDPVMTRISGNEINMSHLKDPASNSEVIDGICYKDLGNGSINPTAIINNNTVLNGGVGLPLRGIELCGTAHDVIVAGNDMRELTAYHANLFVDEHVHNCIFPLNHYGNLGAQSPTSEAAVILCHGSKNRFLDHDFTSTNVTTLCIKIAPTGKDNFVILDSRNFAPVAVQQGRWWDKNLTQWNIDKKSNNLVILSKYLRPLPPVQPGSFKMFFQQLEWMGTLPVFPPTDPHIYQVDVKRRF